MDRVAPSRCRICQGHEWDVALKGPVRVGKFGITQEAVVYRCKGCQVEHLPPMVADVSAFYGGGEYRRSVGEEPTAESYAATHDDEQLRRFGLLEGIRLRGATVADVGCGGGSFLDGVRGYAGKTIAIEPTAGFHSSLAARGHNVFPSVAAAMPRAEATVDLATCFDVIEHVEDPAGFLREIRGLLKPGGTLLLSTPNRQDVLLEVVPDSYRSFWYRRAHLWYFDESNLRRVAQEAGFTGFRARYVQQYGFANFLGWVRDGRPTGNGGVSPMGAAFDATWKQNLEKQGRSDDIYAYLSQ